MATRKPLVVIDGAVRELPTGDTTVESVVTILDANYASVALLMHGGGTNGSTTFTDNSAAPVTATVGGSTQISTTQSKFGGASIKFNGTTDYLQLPASASWNLNGVDFTIEAWVYLSAYPTASPVAATAIFQSVSGGSNWVADLGIQIGLTGTISVNVGQVAFSSSTTLALTAWTHVAMVRSGTTVKLYVGGVATSINATANPPASNLSLYIGKCDNTPGGGGPQAINGYIDDLRITKGVARYTANFTPPTFAFPDAYSITGAPPVTLSAPDAAVIAIADIGHQYAFSRGLALP